jgi:hypothetical protein
MLRLPGWDWLLSAIGFATLASYRARRWLKRQAATRSPQGQSPTADSPRHASGFSAGPVGVDDARIGTGAGKSWWIRT